ncbi:hypothetical protein FISHEDRAFT_63145 [Fistulina hepatica ATCC 64428]|uniref:Uncharacterized protein n=1 Tax=Fistulina hepatica ATCC 64428 TaxID=1128425 RepID=A0A0D6ZZ55_9AGAR|nr:hypothetical protein FISHEDRAFT_63145 [Fistulina hepatica ATCC 64428]
MYGTEVQKDSPTRIRTRAKVLLKRRRFELVTSEMQTSRVWDRNVRERTLKKRLQRDAAFEGRRNKMYGKEFRIATMAHAQTEIVGDRFKTCAEERVEGLEAVVALTQDRRVQSTRSESD